VFFDFQQKLFKIFKIR